MVNRYVIALNRSKIEKEVDKSTPESKELPLRMDSELSIEEVSKIMDIARKFPEVKIESEKLFTCGFVVN